LKVLCDGHRVVPFRAALSNVGTIKKNGALPRLSYVLSEHI